MEQYLYRYKKEKIRLNVVVVYPNTYSIGMSSLALQSLYHLLQQYPDVHCERAFMNSRNETAGVKTVESNRSLQEFDVILFTLSYEPDLINLIKILKLSHIQIYNRNRKGPLIIVGGIAVTFLFYYLKDIADITVSTPAEYALPLLIPELMIMKQKEPFLDKIAGIKGFYTIFSDGNDNIPYYQCNEIEFTHSVILTEKTEFSNRGLIEISRGCLYQCNFCLMSKLYGKYKAFSMDNILKTAENYIPYTNKLGLIAATLTNHPQFKDIIKRLNEMKFQISFSAFRIENLDDELLDLIIKNENKTLVIAPETASYRLKKSINKIIPNETILNTAEKAFQLGLKRLKLYFIIGLPGETMEDLNDNIELVKNLREISLRYSKINGYNPEFIININPLVPKPFTEFENQAMEDPRSIKKKIIVLKNNLRNMGRIYVYGESPKTAQLQYRLSRHFITRDELFESADFKASD